MKPANFGKAIGIDKPANVKAKIAKWQQDLEADNAGPENAVASSSTPSPKLQPTPKAGAPADKSKPAATTPKLTSSSKFILASSADKKGPKKPAHNVLDEDLLSATAPKKRVVSDSNWRKKGSAAKDAAARSPPKQIPNAWVRPAARRAAAPPEPKEPASPTKTDAKAAGKSAVKEAGGRQRSVRRRRPSQPSGSENDKRPSTSGSGSSKSDQAAKEKEEPTSPKQKQKSAREAKEYELVRVRRRQRSGPSPHASTSAEDVSLPKRHHTRSETIDVADLANLITVEYEESVVTDDVRERRRKARRKSYGHVSGNDSPREPPFSEKRRHHRSTPVSDAEDAVRKRPPEPATSVLQSAPPGNRLQAWLQSTPDPIIKAESPKKKKSKEPIPEPGLVPKPEVSDISASSAPKEPSSPRRTRRKSDSKRRERSSRESLHLETQNLGEPVFTESPIETASLEKKPEDVPTPSTTPTLKRRGAKRAHNRQASTPHAAPSPVIDADEVSVAPSSSVDASAVDFEPISPDRTPRLDQPPMRRSFFPTFPSTGKRLSTIASVATFTTELQNAAPSEAVGSEAVGAPANNKEAPPSVARLGEPFNADAMSTLSRRTSKRSRLVSHSDVISVLSMPRGGSKSIVSARSIRTNRSRLATATMSDIMNELASDEVKYMRELRTLVDGVIPVLLSCVLSKSESAVAAGLFSRSSNIGPSDVTKPIVDMGISLEKLKSLHRRIPKDDPDAFISWATSAQRIYADYIKVWRLGFEDVVVNLAPADEDPFTPAKVVQAPSDAAPWDEGLPRNAEGYVVNGDGERVDVAYMLKRPLVRLKYLAKTMRVRPTIPTMTCRSSGCSLLTIIIRVSTTSSLASKPKQCPMCTKIS